MEELFDKLDNMLCFGPNREASDIFDAMPQPQQEAFAKHCHELATDFSACGDWEDGVPPTMEQTQKDLDYVIAEGRKMERKILAK